MNKLFALKSELLPARGGVAFTKRNQSYEYTHLERVRLGFIQRPTYVREDNLEYFVQDAQQAYRTIVPKTFSVTFITNKNGSQGFSLV
ncbi:hypothetical protein RB195_007105 [Necator americanus]|uniref:Uncharacterized protein n=1 Tax=Necator americanus TaxID=51031 RepID=A0ABR1BY58_NECAM